MREWNLDAIVPPTQEPREDRGANPVVAWLMDWEQWLTFGVLLLVVLSVSLSIQGAEWVDGMPSLLVTSLAGLLTAMLLARVRANEFLLHPFGLTAGAVVVTAQALRFLEGGGPRDRLGQLWERMTTWVELVRGGGISTDNLPFVLIVVSLVWLAAYLGGWAAFRWRSGWLAVVPSGVALLINLSYQPRHFSLAFAVFTFGALLLLMQANLTRAIHRWRQQGADYPEFLRLTVLSGTVWVALALLALAFLLPTGGPVRGLTAAWERVRGPVEAWTFDWGIFTLVDAKKPAPIHRFEGSMPLQGAIKLSPRLLARLSASDSPHPMLLRAAVYEEYVGTGWKALDRSVVPLEEALGGAGVPEYRARHEVTATLDPERGSDVLLVPGQLIGGSGGAEVDLLAGAPYPEITRVRGDGDQRYTFSGTISVATADDLRRAGRDYPSWVETCCLGLPEDLPDRVRGRAFEWAGSRDNPYDIAEAIEAELRTYPLDYEVPVAPPGRDAVDYFLFEARRGYFDYHASAMVVLLRVHGIPARLAVGYLPQERDPSGESYLLRERHAFAWVEAFFPGYGWVEFNPTAGSPMIDREEEPPAAENPALPPDQVAPDIAPGIPPFPVESGPVYTLPESQDGRPWGWYVAGGFGTLVALAALALWVVWERTTAGLPYPARLWEKTMQLAGWAGMAGAAHETPDETAHRLQQRLPRAEADAGRLAGAYVRSRYGRKELDDGERRDLARAWGRVRNRLLARILHWR